MSENQYSELQNYEVPPYKGESYGVLGIIVSFIYLVFVCLPLFAILYISIDIVFFIRDVNLFIKKTIKHAKTKLKSKPA